MNRAKHDTEAQNPRIGRGGIAEATKQYRKGAVEFQEEENAGMVAEKVRILSAEYQRFQGKLICPG